MANYSRGYNEYQTIPVATECNLNYTRYVGYDETASGAQRYFSQDVVRTVSKKITELLQGVHPQGKRIIVPDHSICEVMDAVYTAYRPQVGDIYSRYIVPNENINMKQDMIDQTIELIVRQTKDDLGMQEANSKLTKWTTVLGDFNEHQLRSHDVIKILKKRPQPMQFFENY